MDAHSLDRLDFQRIRDLVSEYAMCGLGRSLAGSIRPVARTALVQRWLAQVQEMQRLIEERGVPPFGGICDVRETLLRCAPPLRVTVEEMAQIGATLAGTHAVAAHLRDLPESFPEMRHLAERVGDFQTIADRIQRVIDERARVRDDASPKLARIRQEIAEATHQIQHTVERLLREPGVRRFLQYPNHTFHGDRVVFPLRTEYRGRLPGIVHRTSDSGATLYVEPAEIVELNNRISNLRSEEQEEINRLLWELAHEVHLNGREIHKTLDTLAVVDLVAAKVRFARDFGLSCPKITDDGVLDIRAARHPLLLDLARRRRQAGQTPAPSVSGPVEGGAAEGPEEVVPIDYRIGKDFCLLIVTGPNTGGKTVTLKTVGLLSLMVQAGLPVPVAPGGEMGVFGQVLIDVGDEQSMQQSLSTFSAHMTRLLNMLRHAGPRTLLLIDELGAGTDPDEGAAIGRAVLDELLRLQCRCMATTHLGALKGYALTRSGAENASVEFDSKTLRPTYHLRLGEPGSSNAIDVAQQLGMPRRLISAARRNVSRKARTLQAALEGTRVVKRQAEDARKAADTAKIELEKAQTEAHAARDRLEREHANFHEWVRRVVHLQPGDAVRVRNFDRDGRIVRMRLDQHRAEVDVGAFSVEVPLGDVLPPQAPPPPPRPPLPVVPRIVAAPAVPAARKSVPPPTPRPSPEPEPEGLRAARTEPERQRGALRSLPTRGLQAARSENRSAHASRPEDRGAQATRPEVRASMPAPPSISTEQGAALRPLDMVYVKRFHREGRVVRVNTAKKLAVVNMGLLEVEVPFDGLGLLAKPEPSRPPALKIDQSKATPTGPRRPDASAEAANAAAASNSGLTPLSQPAADPVPSLATGPASGTPAPAAAPPTGAPTASADPAAPPTVAENPPLGDALPPVTESSPL